MKLKIEDKDIKLNPLTLNDLVELEQKIGKKLSALSDGDMGMGEIRFIVWLSVKKQNNELTEEQVGESLVLGSAKLAEIQNHLMGGPKNPNSTG